MAENTAAVRRGERAAITAAAWMAAYRTAREWWCRGGLTMGFPRQAGRVTVRRLWTCDVCGGVVPKGSRVLALELAAHERRMLCLACERAWRKGGQ